MTKNEFLNERELLEKNVEIGGLLNKIIWKEKIINGKIISIKKGIINFDYQSGKIKNFPGVSIYIQDDEKIKEVRSIGDVSNYEGYLGKEVEYSYKKMELISNKGINSKLRRWEYKIKEMKNDNILMEGSFNL